MVDLQLVQKGRDLGASGWWYLRTKAALGKTVHSLIRVFATRGGQIPQLSPEQRFGEGR